MAQILIPDIVLLKAIKSLLKIVKDDYDNASDKTKTYLSRVFGSNKIERYGFYDEAVSIFTAKESDPRKLDVNIFFNMNRAQMPTIHITLPQENPSGTDGIGIDEGYQESEYDDTAQTHRKTYTRTFNCTYQLVITSDNTNEVVAIYHFIRAMLIPLFDHLHASGFLNCKLSGGDLNINPDLIPKNTYIRAIGLTFDYEVSVQKLLDEQTILDIFVIDKQV